MEFKEFTKEQLEEARKCNTEEEKKAFLNSHSIQLPDDVLSKTVGGSSYGDKYKCDDCGKLFDSWWDYVAHCFWDHWVDD